MRRLQCKECKKNYKCWNKWLSKHVEKTGHRKFKYIEKEVTNGRKENN